MHRSCVTTIVGLLLANASSADILHIYSERSATARVAVWDGVQITAEDWDAANFEDNEFHGFAEASLSEGDAIVTARSWHDSTISPTGITARLRHEVLRVGPASPAASFGEVYPGFILEFDLTEASQARLVIDRSSQSDGLLRMDAGLFSGTFADPQAPYNSSVAWGTSDTLTEMVFDLAAGHYGIFLTTFASNELDDSVTGVQSSSDARVTLTLIPEPATVLTLAVCGMALGGWRRR